MSGININIKKKDLYLLAAIGIFLVGVGFVVAYNAGFSGGTPSVVGHSSDEVWVNFSGAQMNLQSALDLLAARGGSGGLLCYRKSSTASNPTLCCNTGEYATGMNVPELSSEGYWTSDSGRCVDFEASASSKSKEIMCCKGGGSGGINMTACHWLADTSGADLTGWLDFDLEQISCPSGEVLIGLQEIEGDNRIARLNLRCCPFL